MKPEIFDTLSTKEKIAHLSEVAGLASYEKYANKKSGKIDKRAGETMPGRNADFRETFDTGLFEKE